MSEEAESLLKFKEDSHHTRTAMLSSRRRTQVNCRVLVPQADPRLQIVGSVLSKEVVRKVGRLY